MTKKEIRMYIKSALTCLAKVKKKLTPNEYADIQNHLLIVHEAIDDIED